MKRTAGDFLREPTVVYRLNAIDNVIQNAVGENRLGNQEKGHEDVCLSHMTSGIQ